MADSSLRPFLSSLWRRHQPLLWLLLLGVALPWSVFLKASSEIQEGEGFPGDQSILRWLHGHATPALDTLNLTLTRVGGPLPMSGLAVLLLGYLWWRHRHRQAWFFALAVGGAMLLNVAAKAVLGRARPAFWRSLAPENTSSFPSGHAMGSMALVLALGLLVPARWRWLSWVAGVPFVLGVGLSRMYLGVHYPSDVAAGWIASTAWVLSVYFLFSPYLRAGEALGKRGTAALNGSA